MSRTSLDTLAHQQPVSAKILIHALRRHTLHPAYLIVGGSAQIRHRLADALGQAVVCQARHDPAQPCGLCNGCHMFKRGSHPDVLHLTASESAETSGQGPIQGHISVDAVRVLRERLMLRPLSAPFKVVYVPHAEQLSVAAQNALLKTLEEPVGAVVFVLLVQRSRVLLATLRSRCQQLRMIPMIPSKRDLEGPLQYVEVKYVEVRYIEAQQNLEAAGIAPRVAPWLAVWLGDDVEAAHLWQKRGAEAVVTMVHQALAVPCDPQCIFQVASELGRDPHRTQMAWAFLEIMLRDALASAQGVSEDQRCILGSLPMWNASQISAAAKHLMHVRRHQDLNLNRPLALENIFFILTQPDTVWGSHKKNLIHPKDLATMPPSPRYVKSKPSV